MKFNGVYENIVNGLKLKNFNPVKDFTLFIWIAFFDLLLFRMDGCSIQHQA